MITINDTVYDGVVFKPDLDDALEHYGKKGMKWRKHLKSAYYKTKSKIGEKYTGFNRFLNGYGTMDISDKRGNKFKKSGTVKVYEAIGQDPKKVSSMIYKKEKLYNGTSNSQTGQEGSRLDAGIAAGRERVKANKNRPNSRKKKVISGTASVKKRGVAK